MSRRSLGACVLDFDFLAPLLCFDVVTFSTTVCTFVGFTVQVGLSPGLELSVGYQLNILGIALTYGGSTLLQYKSLLVKVIAAAFDAPSTKVNEAGSRVLTSVLSSMVLFYPIDQYR